MEITDQIVDWCIDQSIYHSNNLEIKLLWLVVIPYFLTWVYFGSLEYESMEKYRHWSIYLIKIMLLLFLGIWVLFYRYGVRI